MMRKTEIVIRIGLPNWSRARWVLIGVMGVFLIGTVAYATGTYPLTLPTNFNSTTTLSSTTFNTAFGQVNSDVNDLNMRVVTLEGHTLPAGVKIVETRNGKQYSIGATYCGATTMTQGDLGSLTASGAGYAKAKAACQSVAMCNNSASAHMCTSDELLRSAQVDILFGQGWFSTAIPNTGGTDCAGWTSNSMSISGTTTGGSSFASSSNACNSSTFPVLCCD